MVTFQTFTFIHLNRVHIGGTRSQTLQEPRIFRVNPQTTHQDIRRFITNKGQSITLIATLLYSKQRQKNLVPL